MRKFPIMRIVIWSALLAVVLVGRFLWDYVSAEKDAAKTVEMVRLPGGWLERDASVDEWLADISQLGLNGKGKRLTWLPTVRKSETPRGVLVWWHDGQAERLGYIPADGEDGSLAMFALVKGLTSREIVLYNVHNDPGLLPRILDGLSANWALPQQLVILRPPQLAH